MITPSKIIYSRRKSVSLLITPQGELEVRAPFFTPMFVINKIIAKKLDWITTKITNQKHIFSRASQFTPEQIKSYRNQARATILDAINKWSKIMEVSPQDIRLKDNKTRWGSCSGKNNLNFNWKLILTPYEVLEYVVIHELAHIKEKNHSAKFWSVVEHYCPTYKQQEKLLKTFGYLLA